jgi:hypothetical protein
MKLKMQTKLMRASASPSRLEAVGADSSPAPAGVAHTSEAELEEAELEEAEFLAELAARLTAGAESASTLAPDPKP